MIKFSAILKKFFILRLISGLIVLFCLPTFYIHASAGQSGFNDRFYAEQKYLGQINADSYLSTVHNPSQPPLILRGGGSVLVAIVDEGIDFTHPDLQNIQSAKGWNFLDNNNNLAPKGPHGTRLAGIIAANANNNEGIVGLAQNVQIMPLIACDAGYGCDPASITAAIYYAADNGAQVINLSFGDITGYSEIYTQAISYAHAKGAVIVAAAGGNGFSQDLSQYPISPVCNEPVIGVSSIDETDRLPAWANFGNCVDVYVPGTNIFTTTSAIYDGVQYGYFNGSSYSAAIVSGWVALLKGVKPDITYSEIISLVNHQRLDLSRSLSLIIPKPRPVAKVKGVLISVKKPSKSIIKKVSMASKPEERLR